MGINGIGAVDYAAAGYMAGKTEKDASSVGFAETLAQKAAQDERPDYDEEAFKAVGPNAPKKVKDAWMAAAKEVKANGLGLQGNGMMSHISQMMVQRLNKMLKGETEQADILGHTVESAMAAAKKALYDLDHPLADTPKSIAVQQARMKEREFYVSFLEKLENC